MKKLFTPLIFALVFIFSTQFAEARSGCCSHHGGVCGCGCCDGTGLSATCRPYYADVCGDNMVIEPTRIPTLKPTLRPSVTKTPKPTLTPKQTLTSWPTISPFLSPTIEVTSIPTFEPTPKEIPQIMGEKSEIKMTFWQKILQFLKLLK